MAGNMDKIQLPTNSTDISTLVRYLKGIKAAEPLNNNTAQGVYQSVKATGRKQKSYTEKVAEAGGKMPARDTHTTGTLATYGLIRYIDNNKPANFVVSDLGCELISLYDNDGKPVKNSAGVPLHSNGKYVVMLLRVFSAWCETGKGRNIHPGKIMLQLMSDPDLDYYLTEHDVAYFTSNPDFKTDDQYVEIKKSIIDFRSKYDGVYGFTKTCKAEIFMPTFVRNWGLFEKKEIYEISPDEANPGHFTFSLKSSSSSSDDDLDELDGEESADEESANVDQAVVTHTDGSDPEGLGKSIDLDNLFKKVTHYCLSQGASVYSFLTFEDSIESTPNETEQRTEELETTPRNLIVFGAPGTGKSFTINQRKDGLKDGDGNKTKGLLGDAYKDNYERVTFHPDYSYANFVGSYRPVEVDEKRTKKITYKFVPGPFIRVLKKALNNEQPYLLIIEEINRANPAAVFGDVFQLLDRSSDGDSEYSISPSKEMKEYLMSDEDCKGLSEADVNELRIPSNMFIWATMNSADQGVYPMDTAFKRRWDFEYIGINDGENSINTIIQIANGEYYKWNDFRKELNNKLKKYVNEDKLIGPFFIKQVIGEKVIEEDEELEKLNSTIKSKLIMYLFEDVARQKSIREQVFKNADVTLSELFADFDVRGIDIFGLDGVKKGGLNIFIDQNGETTGDGPQPADTQDADQHKASAEETNESNSVGNPTDDGKK